MMHTARRYYARPVRISDIAHGVKLLRAAAPGTVTLEFESLNNREIAFKHHDGDPQEHVRVHVDGTERNFWVECSGPFRKQPSLRDVAGLDLRHIQPVGITTDDGRQYLFLNHSEVPRTALEAFPEGAFRALRAPMGAALVA